MLDQVLCEQSLSFGVSSESPFYYGMESAFNDPEYGFLGNSAYQWLIEQPPQFIPTDSLQLLQSEQFEQEHGQEQEQEQEQNQHQQDHQNDNGHYHYYFLPSSESPYTEDSQATTATATSAANNPDNDKPRSTAVTDLMNYIPLYYRGEIHHLWRDIDELGTEIVKLEAKLPSNRVITRSIASGAPGAPVSRRGRPRRAVLYQQKSKRHAYVTSEEARVLDEVEKENKLKKKISNLKYQRSKLHRAIKSIIDTNTGGLIYYDAFRRTFHFKSPDKKPPMLSYTIPTPQFVWDVIYRQAAEEIDNVRLDWPVEEAVRTCQSCRGKGHKCEDIYLDVPLTPAQLSRSVCFSCDGYGYLDRARNEKNIHKKYWFCGSADHSYQMMSTYWMPDSETLFGGEATICTICFRLRQLVLRPKLDDTH